MSSFFHFYSFSIHSPSFWPSIFEPMTSSSSLQLFLQIFLPLFPLIQAFTGTDTFMANDRCSILLSGSRSQSVRSVFLDCDQGSLLWDNPTGSLLATFTGTSQQFGSAQSNALQICLHFPNSLPEETIIQRISNSSLIPFDFMTASAGPKFGCFPFPVPPSPSNPFQIFIRTGQPNGNQHQKELAFYYALEKVVTPTTDSEKNECGRCSVGQFLDTFCTANFVFIGKFLRHFPEANSMEFSAESPLIRRPLLLTNIASQQKANKNGPSPQFNSTTLFANNCPPNVQQLLRPSLQTKFVVVANAKLGFARLLCLLELAKFEQIPKQNAPCDIKLRRKK